MSFPVHHKHHTAPTNKAFDALPPGAFSDIDNLKSILTYHVIGGSEVDSSSLENGPVDTVNGEPIMITIGDDGTVMVNDATVVTPDIRTSNGIIHAIDKVILPNDDLPEDETEEELGSGPIACTLDVYTCPDGTTLGREGPDCEFPECPTADASTTTTAAAGKASKAVGTKATKVKKVHDPKADKSSPKKSASDPSSTGKSGKTMDKSATPKATPPKKMSSKGNKSSKGMSMPVASTKSAKSMMFSKGAKNKSGLSMPNTPVKKGKSEKMKDDTAVVKSKGQKESDVKPKAEKIALSMPSADHPFAKSSKLAKKGASDAMPKSSAKGDATDGSSKSGKGEVKKMVDAKAIKEAAGEKGPTSKTHSSAKASKKKTVTKASKIAEKKAAGEKKSKGSGKSESKISSGKSKSSKSVHTLDPVADAKAKKVSAKSSKSKSAKHSGKSGKSGSTAALPAPSTEELVDTPATLPAEEESPVACTLDVFTCPDGTTLSREGPDCEFPECPEEEVEGEDQEDPEDPEDPEEEEVDESPDGTTCHFCLDGLTAGADFELPTNGVFTCGQSADFAAKLDTNDDDQAESCDIIQLAQAICCPSENDKDEDLPLLMESGLLDELSSGDE